MLKSHLVSSPQGNATNLFCNCPSWRYSFSFKSPRECYKLLHFLTPYELRKKVFQVPKGMLQTNSSLWFLANSFIGFKSPRECYKPLYSILFGCPIRTFQVPKGMLQTVQHFVSPWRQLQFQVPKGMLQTLRCPTCNGDSYSVSSPQGNATNSTRSMFLTKSFSWVSSPQGNATNMETM